MEQQNIKVDIADGADTSVISIWKLDGNGSKELRFSMDLYKFRGQFAHYMREMKMSEQELLQDVVQYGELEAMMRHCHQMWCSTPHDKESELHYKHYGNEDYLGSTVSYMADRELTDEEKFICTLLVCHASDYGLTSRTLEKMYGWTRYKSRKVAHAVRHKFVGTLISEDREGYFGKGWIINSSMYTLACEYARQVSELDKCAVGQ